jgi:DNA-binding FrmR family transcriptional regulator
MGIEKDKQKILIGLKKAQSLLKNVTAMVEKDQYCVDIMQQNLAVIGLLKSVHHQVMADHLASCFLDGVETGSKSKKKQLVEEMIQVSRLANK